MSGRPPQEHLLIKSICYNPHCPLLLYMHKNCLNPRTKVTHPSFFLQSACAGTAVHLEGKKKKTCCNDDNNNNNVKEERKHTRSIIGSACPLSNAYVRVPSIFFFSLFFSLQIKKTTRGSMRVACGYCRCNTWYASSFV